MIILYIASKENRLLKIYVNARNMHASVIEHPKSSLISKEN